MKYERASHKQVRKSVKTAELGSSRPVALRDISSEDSRAWQFLHRARGVGFRAETGSPQMQNYMYEKAMAQETRNGGTSTLNTNNGVNNSKKKLLIALDVFCLLLGKFTRCFPLCHSLSRLSRISCCGLHANEK